MSTWREVARELGERLEHAAALCGASAGDDYGGLLAAGCAHDRATSWVTAKDCPFCADHAAWATWRRKERRASALAAARATRART